MAVLNNFCKKQSKIIFFKCKKGRLKGKLGLLREEGRMGSEKGGGVCLWGEEDLFHRIKKYIYMPKILFYLEYN